MLAAAAILPGHHISAAGQVGNRRALLIIEWIGVNLRFAVRIEAYSQLSIGKTHCLDRAQTIGTVIAILGLQIDHLIDPLQANLHLIIGHLAAIGRDIGIRTAVNHIIAKTTGYRIIAGTAGKGIGSAIARYLIISGSAADVIRTIAPK